MPNFIRPLCSGLAFIPLMAISICNATYANASPIASNSPKDDIHPNIDRHLSESLYPDEANITEKIADIIEISIRKEYEPYRVCRRVNILRDYPDDKIKIYP